MISAGVTLTFMIVTLVMIGVGFVLTLLALMFLNWGPGAAYDYTGNKMLKRKKYRSAQRNRQQRR